MNRRSVSRQYDQATRPGKSSIDPLTVRKNTPPNILLPDGALRPIQSRLPLPRYTRELWNRRHFIYAQARSRSFSSTRDMFLGRLWIVLDPALQVAIYALVFGLIIDTSRGIDNFIGFLVLGVTFFRIATRGISSGSGLISKSRPLISSFKFPRSALAFSANMRNAMEDLVPVVLAVIVALAFQPSTPVSWTVLLVIPAFLTLYMFCTGMTLIIARLTAFIPDLKGVISVVNRGLFFVSGVFFSIERFDSEPIIQDIMLANPIYQYLHFVRISVLEGTVPSLFNFLYLFGVSSAIFLFGFFFFWSAEERYSSVK